MTADKRLRAPFQWLKLSQHT